MYILRTIYLIKVDVFALLDGIPLLLKEIFFSIIIRTLLQTYQNFNYLGFIFKHLF